MEHDIKQNWRKSLLQHGKNSDRIYLIDLDPGDVPHIIKHLDALAANNGYGKIFAKVPEGYAKFFLEKSYIKEAEVPGFYEGGSGAFFLGKFFSEKRKKNTHEGRIKEILNKTENIHVKSGQAIKDKQFDIRVAGKEDINSICGIYKKVFKTYPFPIHDTEYILETMRSNVRYYVACHRSEIIGVSSSEMHYSHNNTEMTDFATLPEYRGKGLATGLLSFMDRDIAEQGIATAYTIARAISYGINITFAKNGYCFAGTLVNNTNIAGSIESMNVWYKRLDS